MKRALAVGLALALLAGALVVQAADGKPGAARDLRIVSTSIIGIGQKQVVLAWDAPLDPGASPLNAYEIEWYALAKSFNLDRGSNHVGVVTSATLFVRDGDWETIIEIRARNSQGLGPATHLIIPATDARPGPVEDLDVEVFSTGAQRGLTQVHIEWAPPARAPRGIEYYDVYWTGHGEKGILARQHLATAATNATLQLQQGYTYALSVRAYGAFVQGEFAHTNVTLPDLRPGIVRDLATNISPGLFLDRVSVGVSWSPPGEDQGLPLSYEVSYRGIAPSGAVDQGQLDLAATGWTFQGHPEMTYTYRVRAYHDRALGEYVVANVTTPPTRPSAVTDLTATLEPGTSASYRVAWAPPAETAGLPVRNHKIWWQGFGPRGEVHQESFDTAANERTIELRPGYDYLVRVRAETAVALGAFANVRVIVPGDAPAVQPGPVSSLSLSTGATPNQRVASWGPPVDVGASPVTGYVVRWYALPRDGVDFDRSITLPSGARSHTITVEGGQDLLVSVHATTAGGAGIASRVREAIPVLAPSVPQAALIAPGLTHSTLAVSWSPPAESGGFPLLGYEVRVLHGLPGAHFFETAASLPPSATTYTVGGEQGGNYRVHLAARNAQGVSPWVTLAAHLPVRTSGAVSGMTSLLGPGPDEITLSWRPPETNGAEIPPVTGYRILVDHVHPIDGAGTRSFNVGAQDNFTFTAVRGAEHFIRVAPVNAAGVGTATTSSILVSDRAPSAPLDLVIVEGPEYGELTLAWDAPASDGGLGVDEYRLFVIVSNVNGSSWWSIESFAPTLFVERPAPVEATIYVALSARNGAGTGPAAFAGAWIPDRRPSEPLHPSATYGESEGAFAWEYPARDGGIGIDRYLMTFQRLNATDAQDVVLDVGTELAVTIPFEVGYTYANFRLRAENAAAASEFVDFPPAP